MKYDQMRALEVRQEYMQYGSYLPDYRNGKGISDFDMVNLLKTLDKMIGFLDGTEGSGLLSYALVVQHSNILNVARLRGIVE